MSKKTLNLTIEEDTKKRAKRYAKATGRSISEIVEDFLSKLSAEYPTQQEIHREQQMAEAGFDDWAETLE